MVGASVRRSGGSVNAAVVTSNAPATRPSVYRNKFAFAPHWALLKIPRAPNLLDNFWSLALRTVCRLWRGHVSFDRRQVGDRRRDFLQRQRRRFPPGRGQILRARAVDEIFPGRAQATGEKSKDQTARGTVH